MSTTRAAALALFSDDYDSLPEDPDTAAGRRHLRTRRRAAEKAAWCVITGQSVEAYLSLTSDEREAFLELARRR